MATINTLAKNYDPSAPQLTKGGWGFFVVKITVGITDGRQA
jgi:hypothetical protein